MDYKELIDEIWNKVLGREYLGKRRMTRIFEILLQRWYIKPGQGFKDYKKGRKSEWLSWEGFELYKCSSGYFTLTYYKEIDGRRKEAWFCNFDLNLDPYYHSLSHDVSEAYRLLLNDDYEKEIQQRRDAYKANLQ